MNPFTLTRAESLSGSEATFAPDAKFIAGGTNLIDLMREGIERPTSLIDINHLPLKDLKDSGSEIAIGALVTNADVAYSELIKKEVPLLSEAILAGASPQIRNMATTAGNMLQRTRCLYFYDLATACNKREPQSGCGALEGVNRNHAILGTSLHCIATHPSDMCVALSALKARIVVKGPRGDREILFRDFHRLPGDHPEKDNVLELGELITAVHIPKTTSQKYFAYIKVRERNSYAFALTSIAVTFELENGVLRNVRCAMGGVAHKPWWRSEAETFLEGQAYSSSTIEQAADIFLEGAQGFGENNFKVVLAKRTFIRGFQEAFARGSKA